MSTRANIIIKDQYDKLYFYRHSDGYPKGTLPTLEKFLSLVKSGKIRDNASQSAGWLIVIGAIEYQTVHPEYFPESKKESYNQDDKEIESCVNEFSPDDWKVGAYEPTTGIHGDIEHLYVIDLDKKEILQIPASDWKNF
jgi:hypothetical protein